MRGHDNHSKPMNVVFSAIAINCSCAGILKLCTRSANHRKRTPNEQHINTEHTIHKCTRTFTLDHKRWFAYAANKLSTTTTTTTEHQLTRRSTTTENPIRVYKNRVLCVYFIKWRKADISRTLEYLCIYCTVGQEARSQTDDNRSPSIWSRAQRATTMPKACGTRAMLAMLLLAAGCRLRLCIVVARGRSPSRIGCRKPTAAAATDCRGWFTSLSVIFFTYQKIRTPPNRSTTNWREWIGWFSAKRKKTVYFVGLQLYCQFVETFSDASKHNVPHSRVKHSNGTCNKQIISFKSNSIIYHIFFGWMA